MDRCFDSTQPLRLVASLAIACGISFSSPAQQLDSPPPAQSTATPSAAALRARSLQALQTGDRIAAIAAADALVQDHADDPETIRRAADIYLRSGKVDTAVDLFDRYVQARPQQMPYLWQRGIALYFAGKFQRGAEQFEAHRQVNPNDVENAAWHFLCVAKAQSPEKARELLLPAPGDPRVPMAQVLEMLRSGDTEAVRRQVERLPEGSQDRADAEFYGNFYLGLYADARGDRQQAQQLLSQAARDAPRHYMGDVARLYAQHLSP
jgi:lipoprotein NlpI